MHDTKHKKVKEEKRTEEDYKTKYLRALADYQNFEKRVAGQYQEASKRTKKELLIKLLPFLDNLEKAEAFIKDDGMKMVKQQFLETLAKEGLEEMTLEGQEYDPYKAEAVEVIEGNEDNKIIEVTQKGYLYDGQVLRPALVKVSKKPEANKDN